MKFGKAFNVTGFLSAVLFIFFLLGCGASSVVKDATDLAGGVDRRPIDYSKMAVNAFANDARFGSASAQFSDIKNSLHLNRVRIFLAWDNGAQSSPTSGLNFSFADSVISSLPDGMEALVILGGLPDWMANSANWEGANPRATFVSKWVAPVVRRYAANSHVAAFQIWNEPNMANQHNQILDLIDSPENYVEMLARAHNVVKDIAPGKLVLNAATTAINQNYSDTLDYNRKMRDAGALSFVDVYAIHYYGKQFENVVRPGGVADFLNGLNKPIWVTESGAQGVNSQLAYGETAWPYLFEKIPAISRVYIYQYAEASAADSTYGLRNLTAGLSVSDLYVALRDR